MPPDMMSCIVGYERMNLTRQMVLCVLVYVIRSSVITTIRGMGGIDRKVFDAKGTYATMKITSGCCSFAIAGCKLPKCACNAYDWLKVSNI